MIPKPADRSVEVWGTGSYDARVLHVDDLKSACLFLLENYSGDSHINVGTGIDLSIKELAETIQSIVHPDAVINGIGQTGRHPPQTSRHLSSSSTWLGTIGPVN